MEQVGCLLTARVKILFILAAMFLLNASAAQAEQLYYGKYFGVIQMSGQAEAIAVSLDAFVVQTKGPEVYPALDVIMRLNLGGYSSSEYVGYHFSDPTFNFEKGILQLSDPGSDLTATLEVKNTENEAVLEGTVTHRLANTKGKMRVEMKFFGAPPEMPAGSLLTTLKGEYAGKCGSDPALLQVETGRGIGVNSPGNALAGYAITGRLGFTNGPLCPTGKAVTYCSLYPYSTGVYSPFTNRFRMQGPLGTIDCAKSGNTLRCTVFGYNKSGSCVLTKKSALVTPPAQVATGFPMEVLPELKLPLPAPLPPDNDELVRALSGEFSGFLHFENRDEYQLMEMNVVASSSTENPHIQNQVLVEPTVLLRLGSNWDSPPAISIAFPQRVFGMNTGFAFQADGLDYFVVIQRWQTGYLSGVLYSQSFGRVGTFELEKGARPLAPSGMALILDPAGSYSGPKDSTKNVKDIWKVHIEVPSQIPDLGQVGIPLLGRYSGPAIMGMFSAASFDFNTGALSFLLPSDRGDRLITGEIMPERKLKLVWPTGPALGAPMDGYGAYIFESTER